MVFHNILEGHTPEEVAAAVTAFVFPDKVEMPEDIPHRQPSTVDSDSEQSTQRKIAPAPPSPRVL